MYQLLGELELRNRKSRLASFRYQRNSDRLLLILPQLIIEAKYCSSDSFALDPRLMILLQVSELLEL